MENKKKYLEIRNLKKTYPNVKALQGISFDVYANEILAILGPNGAGKTTAINCLCGVIPYDSGKVFLEKQDAGFIPKNKLGLCPQELIIWDNLTLLEQLHYIACLYNQSKQITKVKAETLLAQLGLSAKKKSLAKNLSGGMKRRLNIALSLMHNPELVVLDEPEAGLDPQSRLLIRTFIKSQAKERTIVLTTHNMDEAERLADRVILIDYGQIIDSGTVHELIKKHNCQNLEGVFFHLTGRSLREL